MAHPPPPPNLTPLQSSDPRVIPPFAVHGRLGAGGMGVVYGAVGPDGRWAAVKVVRPEYAGEPEFRSRFASEVALMHRVRARCIAPVLAHDTRAELPWYATPYLPGPTLGARVRQGGALAPHQARVVAAGMAEAIAAIHAAGVVHRDLKPANVILAPDGPKVLDFGIARAADATALTRTGGLVGSPAWMSPERYRGTSGPEADVFAWGAMVAYTATGRPPFGDGGAETLMYRILREDPDLEGLPPELEEPVTRALDKDPASRPSAGELLHRVAAADPQAAAGADDTTIVDGLIRAHWAGGAVRGAPAPRTAPTAFAPPPPAAGPGGGPAGGGPGPAGAGAAPPPRRRLRRAPVVIAAGALAVAAVGGIGLVNALEGGDPDPPAPDPAPSVETAEPGTLTGTVNGAGSTFLSSAVEAWSASYTAERQPDTRISYEATGSGAGADAFVRGEVDFGASENALTESQAAEAEEARGCPVVQFPVLAGGVALVYNAEGLDGLSLARTELADIYSGAVTSYSDLDGAADLQLPDLEIVPVRHESEASTAHVFTRYLAADGGPWGADNFGDDTRWGPGVVAASGDEGVHAEVAATPGALGFVNASYAEEHGLDVVPLRSDRGVEIDLSPATTRAATEQIDLDGTDFSLDAVGGDSAYPIMRVNHVFAYECGHPDGTGSVLRDFWAYALGDEGARIAEGTGYTPLADSVGARVVADHVSRIAEG
ncbi:protein kinase domain-containing protein [Nocardiopsis sp. CA-288880]|uniref:protein kinase domain-containing protein n=1 Tax=Nocardiopsis sp. CA-288880 TaxID=3239995 RepID=UPI003D98D59D